MVDRTFADEVAKRAAEAGGGLAAAVKALAVQNHAADQAAYRQRVFDSHKVGMNTLGADATPVEDMGNITVTGDVYGNEAVQMLAQSLGGQSSLPATPTPTASPTPTSAGPATEPVQQAAASPLAAAVLGAALLAAGGGLGAGIPWLLGAFNQVEAVDTDTDTITEIEAIQAYQPSNGSN